MSNLCCCEYIDREGEHSHILACCCNCQDLDECFESVITCKGVSSANKEGLIMTVRDRFRFPWMGGAMQLKPEIVIPMLGIPAFLLFASVNLSCSILSGLLCVTLLGIMRRYYMDDFPKFLVSWCIVSLIVLYLIYELLIVSFLLILLEENLALSLLTLAGFACFFRLKWLILKWKGHLLNKNESDKTLFCSICQINTPEGTEHFYWFDCCVMPENRIYYNAGLVFTLASLLYSSNLSLTTVCRPFRLYLTILMPDDCSDVYEQIELGLSFATALYSILLAVFVFCEILRCLCNCICRGKTNHRSNQRIGFLTQCCKVLCCCFNHH